MQNDRKLNDLTIVPLRNAAATLNVSERKLRAELFAAGFQIIEFSPRKRGVLLSSLDSLIAARLKPALPTEKHEPAHV